MLPTTKKFCVLNLSCNRQQKKIFSDISFQLHDGQGLLIHGDNGCGKSSLLRLLAGVSTPDHGEIFWQGQSIQKISPAYWAELHYIGHANGIKLGLSVMENLQLFCKLANSFLDQLDFFLERLQLIMLKNTLASHLSAGQKRRLALAKLFLFPKSIWILDEPLTALDEKSQTFFLLQLEKHLQNGGISIISSHQIFSSKLQSMRLDAC